MKRSGIGALIAFIIVLALLGLVVMNKKPATDSQINPTSQQLINQENTNAQDLPATATESSSPGSNNASATQTTVLMENSSFNPAKVTIKKGSTVTWTNKDSIQHDVQPDQETEDFKGSELLNRGESYRVTFNKVGTYTYYCTPHRAFMKGTVEVVE